MKRPHSSTPPFNPPYRRRIKPVGLIRIKVLLNRLLPLELVFEILRFASIPRPTAFINACTPISYHGQGLPQASLYCWSSFLDLDLDIPFTLHVLSPPCAIQSVGDHPFQSVKFRLRYRLAGLDMMPANWIPVTRPTSMCYRMLKRAQISFEARLLRGGKLVEESRTLIAQDSCTTNGILKPGQCIWLGAESDFVKMARPGDQIGMWVALKSNWQVQRHHDLGFKFPPLLEVREVSIECFCRW